MATLRKRNFQAFSSIGLVIASSIFALVASGLKAYNDVVYSGLHTLSLIVMLFAFVFFIAVFMTQRGKAVPDLILHNPTPTTTTVTPCSSINFLFVDPQQSYADTHHSQPPSQDSEPKQNFPVFDNLSLGRRREIRVAIIRNALVDLPLLEQLIRLPNLSLIDLQHCRIAPETWHSFSEFDKLKHLAVFATADPSEELEFAYTLPEIKTIFEPTEFIPAQPKVL
jgi:hypothetical protein